jgi:hypothetical protein
MAKQALVRWSADIRRKIWLNRPWFAGLLTSGGRYG